MTADSWSRDLLFNADTRRQGLLLMIAVVVAFDVSATFGLPEPLWSVMSALIVMRPNSALTLDAALARVGSTLFGVLCGLVGVGLGRVGVSSPLATLVIVAALAYASGAIPNLRGSSIAALIVVSSLGISGHSAEKVALLRVVQILIGVGIATVISAVMARHRSADRLFAGCARLLRGAAAQLTKTGQHTSSSEEQAEAAAAVARQALDRLSDLARGADRVRAIWPDRSRATENRHHRRIAGLTRRVFQDVTVFNRIVSTASGTKGENLAHEVAQVASETLMHMADVLDGNVHPDHEQFRRLADGRATGMTAEAAEMMPQLLLAAPSYLLGTDLQRLSHLCERGN